MRRVSASLLVALVAVGLLTAPAAAAVLWTLVVSPLTATTGQSTSFTLTATNENLLQDIRCIRVDVGSQFAIEWTGITSVSNGGQWTSFFSGSTATVRTSSGGDRLRMLQSVRFSVRARPLAPGAFAWRGVAYEQEDCTDALTLTVQLDAIVVTGAVPTPTATPGATPTLRPTGTPTPTPRPIVLPTLPLPTALPTIAIPSLPLPTIAIPSLPPPSIGPSSSPVPTASPTSGTTTGGGPVRSTPSPSEMPSASPSQQSSSGSGSPLGAGPAGPSGGGGASTPTGVATAGTGRSRLAIRTAADGEESQLAVPLLGTLQVGQLWWVPAATIGGPGLLVILWVALQLLAGLAWLPVTRRFRRQEPRAAWTLVSTRPNR